MIKYLETRCIVNEADRTQQIESAVARGLPVCKMRPAHNRPVAIVASGPSILDYRDEITAHKTVWAINGAYDFLQSWGLVSDFVACDAHEAMLAHCLEPDVRSTFYLATVIHPKFLDRLARDHNVKLWHSYFDDMPDKYKPTFLGGQAPGQNVVFGGTTCVTRAVCLARMLGYRDITVYGAESSFGRHGLPSVAGLAGYETYIEVQVTDCDEVFLTTPALLHQASEIAFFTHLANWRCGGLTGAFLASPMHELAPGVEEQAMRDHVNSQVA